MYDIIYDITPRFCPRCGKEFYPTSLWVYKTTDGILYCSWKCIQAKRKEDAALRRKKYNRIGFVYKKVEQLTLNGELVEVHDSVRAAAYAVNGKRRSIYAAIKHKIKYKSYLWRYQDEDTKECG
jgi:hypothetical protein